MLLVGLTGGIGSGKSTVAARLDALGAVVLDADRIAREVVEPGTPGIARVRDRFGDDVIRPDGSLDRPALGRIVFDDPGARHDLEAIIHPAVRSRTAELRAAAVSRDPAAVVVHDVPLLVEKAMGGEYHLVLVVEADEEERVRRLGSRGVTEEDARARMRTQAGPVERRAAADVVIDNNGLPEQTRERVDSVWHDRIVPFERNLRTGTASTRPEELTISPPDPTWVAQASRLIGRLRRALGPGAVTTHHIGSTSVPALPAKDVIDLQVGVESVTDADDPDFVAALAAAGFPRVPGVLADRGKPWPDSDRGGGAVAGPGEMSRSSDRQVWTGPWQKRFHLSCDPGRVAHVHVREVGSPGWRWALLFRDWLRADPEGRTDYAALKSRLESAGLPTTAYTEAKEPWFDAVRARVEEWARCSGWSPT